MIENRSNGGSRPSPARRVAGRPEVGNYFVANYPPFSVWTARGGRPRRAAGARTRRPRRASRSASTCTSRSAASAATSATSASTPTRTRSEVDAVPRRARRASGSSTRAAGHRRPAARTSSTSAAARRRSSRRSSSKGSSAVEGDPPWDEAEEITFECEPGTLTEAKLAAIRELGVTRLSLGVENFDDDILELNGRAHRSRRDRPRLRLRALAGLSADQHRPDRRHGRRNRRRTGGRASRGRWSSQPDSVTIYQMELPFNTTISSDLLRGTGQVDGRSPTGRPSGAGSRRRSKRSSARATTSAAPTPPSRIRRARASSIAIGCGRAPTWSAWASRRSATSTASTSRTSIAGTRMWRPSIVEAAAARARATGRRLKSA